MTKIILSKPTLVMNEPVGELTFREPNGKDLVAAGYPVRIMSGGEGVVDAAAMTKLIARLAGVPPDSIERLTVPDWTACMMTVMGFFGASAPTNSSTAISTPPDSGAIN